MYEKEGEIGLSLCACDTRSLLLGYPASNLLLRSCVSLERYRVEQLSASAVVA